MKSAECMISLKLWLISPLLLATFVCSSDLGINTGSKAASQLVSESIHSALQNPKRLNIELLSARNPWFDPVAHLTTEARVLARDLNVRFHDDLVDVLMSNLSVKSNSNIILPLPFFLGEDNVVVNAEIPYAVIKLKADENKLRLDSCEIANPSVDFNLERSLMLNYLLKPFAQLPASFLESLVCNSISKSLAKLRNKFEVSIPLIYVLPAQFRSRLAHKNTTLVLQLQTVQSKDEQLTMVAGIEWKETKFDMPSMSEKPIIMPPEQSENDIEEAVLSPQNYSDQELASRRLEIWAEDRLFNEAMEKFDWDFEWLAEQIPVNSDKLPPSTTEFLSVLCSDCYFEVKVSSTGVPYLETLNKTLVLTKRNQIFMKVVNPSLSKNSVLINFFLTLKVQIIPTVEDGVFRTQINLFNTSTEIQKGAFPDAWNVFVQDLVRDMIMNVVWPEFKKKIEALTYSNGLKIPRTCGPEPRSIHMYVDESRFGVSGSLVLEEFSIKQCLKDFKQTLPDTSDLFNIQPAKF